MPWSYKEGLLIGGGLFVVGAALQWSMGGIRWSLLAFPVNVIVLTLYLVALIVMHALRKRIYLFDRLSTPVAAVSALAWTAAVTVAMGLIRQRPSGYPADDPFGFTQMISAWQFVLPYLWLLTSLGLTVMRTAPELVVVRPAYSLRIRKLPSLSAHLGLFVALLAATLGSADMQRLKMTVQTGQTEWRAVNERGNLTELPLAIELHRFSIDEYPPKLMLTNNATGETLPPGRPAHLSVGDSLTTGDLGDLGDWHIRVQQILPSAAAVTAPDTIYFAADHAEGAVCALLLTAVNRTDGTTRTGWVSCGSFAFPDKRLRLDSLTSIVMPDRKPKRFASEVSVCTPAGERIAGVVEVNSPLRMAGWNIYQHGYDAAKGRWSTISVFELVRDPWLPAVYAGIWLLALGAAGMFIGLGQPKKRILGFSIALSVVFVCVNLFKPEIHSKTLMPALQSPWFAPHVIAYMFAYTLLGVAAVTAIYLLWIKRHPAKAREMELCDNLIRVGIVFLTFGMISGAVWAKEAWGHYWSWDPKETWAAATWFVYLIYIHYRYSRPRAYRRALVMVLIAFVLLQMCWYGINYLPSAQGASLHTYSL
jgi:ABC-type transport system involved in cytochrome c biogenesis permease subunit